MGPIAWEVRHRLRGVRRVVRRWQPRVPAVVRPRSAPPVVNLVPNPGFRAAGSVTTLELDGVPTQVRLFDQPFERGGVYVHHHNVGFAAPVPGLSGVTGVRVRALGADNDTHVAPGGRNAADTFRLGMRPGATYTASVGLFLPAPLTGRLNPDALSISVGCVKGGVTRWNVARSHPARNEYGHHRVSVTFTVPPTATAAWIRLVSGMAAGHGEVWWHSYTLTETDHDTGHVDGAGPDDAFHTYAWTGAPDASPSRRELRDPAVIAAALGADAAELIADEAVRLARRGTAAEADVLAGWLATRGEVPYRVVRARVARARGDEAGARTVLRPVADADPSGDAAFELGASHEAAGWWTSAERWYRIAHERRPELAERAYRLARALDRLKRRDESKRAAAAGLDHDPALPFDGRAVLQSDVKCFGARREVGLFVAAHLEQIRTQARQRMAAPAATTFDLPVFVYWGQGFAQAPPLVRRCLEALRAANPDLRVHELTDATWPYYVDVPPDLVAAVGDDRTHFSDLLRLALLERYGGIWLDATCLVTEPLRPRVAPLLDGADLFAFSYTGPHVSSWFLAARPGSYPVHLLRAALWLWWERRGELVDYFLLHHVFEMLYWLDADFAAAWDAGHRLGSRPPHALQQAMLEPYDARRWARILDGAWVHKLRYKYAPAELTADSFVARLLRDDLPPPGV